MKRVLLFTALIVWSGMASAVVYKWIDAQGKVHYGDRPPDGVQAEVVEFSAPTSRGQPRRQRHPRAGPPRAEPLPPNVRPKPSRRRWTRTSRRRVRSNAPMHRTATRSSSRAGTSTRLVPNGERQYLTSEEIDTERVNAKREVDAVCNGAPPASGHYSRGTARCAARRRGSRQPGKRRQLERVVASPTAASLRRRTGRRVSFAARGAKP